LPTKPCAQRVEQAAEILESPLTHRIGIKQFSAAQPRVSVQYEAENEDHLNAFGKVFLVMQCGHGTALANPRSWIPSDLSVCSTRT